jgi:hypothetical protein
VKVSVEDVIVDRGLAQIIQLPQPQSTILPTPTAKNTNGLLHSEVHDMPHDMLLIVSVKKFLTACIAPLCLCRIAPTASL